MPAMVMPVGPCVIVRGVSWGTYTYLLADCADRRGTRIAYDHGTLARMAPSCTHAHVADVLADVVKAVAEAQGLDVVPAGSTTFKREDVERGFEPDASCSLQHAAAVRGHTTIDLDVDPPPDLIIAIDLSHPSLDTFPIDAALGVPEVWRSAGQPVSILHRTADASTAVPCSAVLPEVTSVHLTQWVQTGREMPRLAWIRRVRTWAASRTQAP